MKENEMIDAICKWYGACYVGRELGIKRSSLARYREGVVKKVDNKVIEKAKEMFANMENTPKMYCRRRIITKPIGRPRKFNNE